MHLFETIVRDVRYACRSLARRPGLAAVAVITLALGLGTMTVAFDRSSAPLREPRPAVLEEPHPSPPALGEDSHGSRGGGEDEPA